MPKVSPIQHSFNAGEASPLLEGRSDVAKYKNGLRICLNWLPLIQGGLVRRPPSYYAAPTKGNGVARMVRFEFSVTQAYIIELGNLYARFYMNGGPILETAKNITGATQANPCQLTVVGHGFSVGEDIEVVSVVGMTQLNSRRFTVNTVVDADHITIKNVDGTLVDSSAYTAYTSGGTASRVYTVTTTYASSDLFQLRFTQSADTLYIAHKTYAQRKLTRSAHTSWTLTQITFLDGPYLPLNTTTTTITLSGTSGSVTATASAALFAATDVGRLIRWKDPAGNWTWLTITAFTSTTVVTVTISGPNASAGTATLNWRLGVWSTTTGFPAAVGFNQDRLVFGGTTSYPQRVDFSNSGDYENCAPSNAAGTVADSNAFFVNLAASDQNVVRWLQDDEKGLLIGTAGGEWVIRPAATTSALSPTNYQATRSTTYGSADVAAVRAGRATLYLQRAARKLRELTYIFQLDGFHAPDLTTLSEHITLGGIKDMGYQQETQSILWMTRNDGTLVGFTYSREQDVLAWHRHTLGGYSDSAQTVAAKVESVACIPAQDGTRDELWMVVNRYVNGTTRRYVEFLKKPWEHGDLQADGFHADCGLSLNNTVAQTLTPGAGATVKHQVGVVFVAGGAVFVASDVGRYIHYDYTDSAGVAQRASALITAFTDSTHVTVTINYPWPNVNTIGASAWRMSVAKVTNLWHLEGQPVALYLDGAVQPTQTVVSGTVNFQYPASKGGGGLAYNSDGQMLRIDAGAADGTALGKLRRIHKAAFLFLDALGIKIGRDFANLVQKSFRKSSDPMSAPPALFSGVKTWEWEGDEDTEGFVTFRVDQPVPCTLLAVMPKMLTQDNS